MNTVGFGRSDMGLRRVSNQDRFVVDDVAGVYAVADGIGGVRQSTTGQDAEPDLDLIEPRSVPRGVDEPNPVLRVL